MKTDVLSKELGEKNTIIQMLKETLSTLITGN